MRGCPRLLVVVVFEERRIDHPQEVPFPAVPVLGNQLQLLGHVHAQVGHHGLHHRLATKLEDQQITGFGAGFREDRRA